MTNVEVESKLREMMARGKEAQAEWATIEPRISTLKEAVHDMIEEPDADLVVLHRTLQVLRMLERLFRNDIDGMAIAQREFGTKELDG